MQAHVYKSLRKADTYVYLAQRDGFDVLPADIRAQLGALEFVLEVELSVERKLARVDAAQVRDALQSRGFHLQMPPPPDAPTFDATAYYRSRDA